MRGKKSQASMEIFFIVGTVIFFFIILSWVVVERRAETTQTKDFLDKRDLCIEIANSVSSVYSGKDGSTLKIPNIKYGINISPSYRTIEIYDLEDRKDFVVCSVPVEKVIYYYPEAGYNGSVEKYQETFRGFGSAEYSFEINTSTIQLRNIEDRVFICPNCSLNEVDYAEGLTTQGSYLPLTNPIKRLDGETFTLVAAGEGNLPGEYFFNIAVIKLGDSCLVPMIESIGYDCVTYDFNQDCVNPKSQCNLFKSTAAVSKCLFNQDYPDFINWYTLLLYEDFQTLDEIQLNVLQDRVSRAAWALLSGNLWKRAAGYVAGAFVYENYDAGVAEHFADDSQGFLELPVEIYPTFDFSGEQGAITNPDTMADFEPLYRFIAGQDKYAIARWKYPDQTTLHGDIYYFTDYCKVEEPIKELIQKIMDIGYYSWVRSEFNLARQINGEVPALNPINIYVGHEITDSNYVDKTSWISRIEWCNLDTGCASWNIIEVGEVSDICENHVSEYINKKIAKCTINLGNPDIKNIGLKIKFTAPSGSGRVPIDIDFIQVETCY